MTLHGYLLVSVLMFTLGLFAVIERRSSIAILIGIELMLNASSVNFVAFSRFLGTSPAVGQLIALVVMGLAAAEVALALSIIVAIARSRQTVDVERLTGLRG